jgi:hypothetical protein
MGKDYIFVFMNKIKEEILETFEDVEFILGKDKLLVGYAEMFGVSCIPLYTGINFLRCASPEEAILKIESANPKARTADGFEKCLIGHLKTESGVILLYDKEAVLEKLMADYRADTSGLFDGEEDIELSAIEFYEYNILGSYMQGIPAFAILYK